MLAELVVVVRTAELTFAPHFLSTARSSSYWQAERHRRPGILPWSYFRHHGHDSLQDCLRRGIRSPDGGFRSLRFVALNSGADASLPNSPESSAPHTRTGTRLASLSPLRRMTSSSRLSTRFPLFVISLLSNPSLTHCALTIARASSQAADCSP